MIPRNQQTIIRVRLLVDMMIILILVVLLQSPHMNLGDLSNVITTVNLRIVLMHHLLMTHTGLDLLLVTTIGMVYNFT